MSFQVGDHVRFWVTMWGAQKRCLHGQIISLSEDGRHARVNITSPTSTPRLNVEVSRLLPDESPA